MTLSKPWYKSKTIIFNAVMTVMLAAEASFGMLEAALPANWFGIISFALTMGNVVLRVITTGPVTAK